MNFLRQERELLGLQGREVYERLEVSKGTYIRWEAGHAVPSDQLAKLYELGFDVGYVVTGKRTGPSASIDEALLEKSVEQAERLMDIAGKRYTAAQKARIISLVYQVYIEENVMSDESLGRILRLVS